MARQIEITENTKIPLYIVGVVFVFISTSGVGGVFWFSTLYADVAQAKKDISALYDGQKETSKILRKLDRGMIRVQDKLGIEVPDED